MPQAYDSDAVLTSLGEPGQRVLNSIPTLKNNYRVAKQQTEEFNPDRMLNLAMYVGNQTAEWRDTMGVISPTEVADTQDAPVTDNVVRVLVDQRVATQSNQTPTIEAVAGSSQLSDLSAARLADKLGKGLWERLEIADAGQRAKKVATIQFNAFLRGFWDYTAGRFVSNNDPVSGASKTEPEGDIQVEVVSPMQVFVDPLANRVMPERISPTDARWLFHLTTVDIGAVVGNPRWKNARAEQTDLGRLRVFGGLPPVDAITGTDAALPTSDGVAAAGELRQNARDAAAGASVYGDAKDSAVKGKLVKLLCYYEHPNDTYRHGRYAIFMPDNGWHVLEYQEELPHATKEHPDGLFLWVMMVDNPLEGRLVGTCRVSEVSPIQRLINERMTRIRDMWRRFKPIIFVNAESGVEPEDIEDTSVATMIRLHANAFGGDKNPLTVVSTNAQQQEAMMALNDVVWLTHRAEDKIGIHNPAYHPHKEGTTLGEIEMVMVRDINNIKDTDVARDERTVFAPLMKGLLRLAQRYYSDDRMLAYFGDAGRASVQRFRAGDIKFEDVRIRPGTTMAESSTMLLWKANKAFEAGFFADPDPMTARLNKLDYAEMVGMKLTLENSLDILNRNRQREECWEIVAGGVPNIHHLEYHELHMHEIVRFVNSPDFYALPSGDKERVWAGLMAHYELHKQMAIQGKQAAPPDLAAAAGGAPGAAAGGPMMGGMVGAAMPTTDGRVLVPQEPGGTPKSGNLFGGGGDIPADAGIGAGGPQAGPVAPEQP